MGGVRIENGQRIKEITRKLRFFLCFYSFFSAPGFSRVLGHFPEVRESSAG